jgi:pimeloyl-ACP methyl ester carboxylesterase
MDKVHRAYADGPFGQIHYRIARSRGAKPARPLICLHQSPKSGRDFERLIGRLGRARTCVAPDTPGYGNSDPPPANPVIADYGESILHLVDGLQARGDLPPGPFDLLGYHTGSAIAAWIARHAPNRVGRIICVSLPVLDAQARQARLSNMDVFPVPRADASNIDALWALTETLNDRRLDPEWRHRALGECLCSGSRLPWGFRAVFAQDVAADLQALDHPALVLCPRDDLWDETHAAVGLLRNARLVPLADAGNGFLDLDTDRVAAVLSDFLDR